MNQLGKAIGEDASKNKNENSEQGLEQYPNSKTFQCPEGCIQMRSLYQMNPEKILT